MKKIISIMIALITVFSIFCVNAAAEESYKIITANSSTGVITITSDKETATPGETVSLAATVNGDYLFSEMIISYKENGKLKETKLSSSDGKSYKFTMPEADVTAYGTVEKSWHDKKIEIDFTENYGYGGIFLDKYSAKYGETINIRAVAEDRYTVEYLTVNDIKLNPVKIENNEFYYTYTVDAKEVKIDAKFRKTENTLYKITVDTRIGGTGFADKKKANPGDTVTVTVRPESGKKYVTVTVDNVEISGKDNVYTFTMPDHDVVIDIICSAQKASDKPTWERNQGKWKLKGLNGKYITGWYKLDNVWYYLNNAGVMEIGWVKDGKWYYLKDTGAMATGWIKDNNKWYYLDSNGAMKTGWVMSGNKWYYLLSSGEMAVDTYIDNKYKIGTDGAWIK